MNISFYTLGCKLNFSETSFIANDLKNNGFNEVNFNEIADIYVINTCTVTENANKECKYLVRKALRQNQEARVIIMGCYAQLKPKEIQKIKGVDLILGNNEKFKLQQYLSDYSKNEKAKIIQTNTTELTDFRSAFSFGNRTRSFLKIQDGCNYKCTFCTIPLARGINRSDEINNIIKRINQLKKTGIKEIVLTGVNIGDFKTKNNKKLIDLLKEIDLIDNIRVRISSIEPNLITSEIIDLISKSNTFVPHFHIPLQSGSDTILKAMKRRYLTKKYQALIEEINSKIHNVCIGVDVIVGFPGETDVFFNETL
ncbi:MAG: tRNA (N(6)-L-threonylcarbamoyladenosine(37)-C(2))-methylthiotransferase MtaB, partial [Flavobacteriales bacterium]|nr:tRNA (N(6)-L-threonylcarbamoyladenosine(37)-C(2))-methylthiotransferase MtaB [Flavobacteriales bacterium]